MSASDLKAVKRLQMHLTLDQVAAMLSLSKRTVQKLVADQAFPEVVYVTSSDVRIPASAFSEFIEHRTVRRP